MKEARQRWTSLMPCHLFTMTDCTFSAAMLQWIYVIARFPTTILWQEPKQPIKTRLCIQILLSIIVSIHRLTCAENQGLILCQRDPINFRPFGFPNGFQWVKNVWVSARTICLCASWTGTTELQRTVPDKSLEGFQQQQHLKWVAHVTLRK